MTTLPRGTALGHLEIIEVYDYYDGPRLFVAQNATGTLFLAFWADDSDGLEIWLYVPVSERRLELIKTGGMDIRSAFTDSEDETVYVARLSTEGNAVADPMHPSRLEHDWLPPEGDTVRAVPAARPPEQSEAWTSGHWLRISRLNPTVQVSLQALTSVLGAWRHLFTEALVFFGVDEPLIPVATESGSFRIALKVTDAAVSRQILEVLLRAQDIGDDPHVLRELQSSGISSLALVSLFIVLADHQVHLSVTSPDIESTIELSPLRSRLVERAFRASVQQKLETDQVPQADELSRVFRLLDLKAQNEEVTTVTLGVVPRQLSYYKQAARILGYLDSANELTDAGKQLVLLEDRERLATTVIQFERTRCGLEWIRWQHGRTLLDVDENSAVAFLNAMSLLGGTTATRRAQTLRSWHRSLTPYHYRLGGK